jgi:hypothetical protein
MGPNQDDGGSWPGPVVSGPEVVLVMRADEQPGAACGSGDPLLCLVIGPSICDLAMVGIAGRSRRTDDRQLPRPSGVRVL